LNIDIFILKMEAWSVCVQIENHIFAPKKHSQEF